MGKNYKTYSNYSLNQYFTKRRNKSDWAGISIGDAFKSSLDYYIKLPSKKLFYRVVRDAQKTVLRIIGVNTSQGYKYKASPQLAPCYTSYPSTLAAYAAIGLTMFLEYERNVEKNVLMTYIAEYLKDPAIIDRVKINPVVYKNTAKIVAKAVQTRLILEEIKLYKNLHYIEMYRLYSASQQNLKFQSLPEIINCIILYGDLLPDLQNQNMHLITRDIITDISDASIIYIESLQKCKSHLYLNIGNDWVQAIMSRLVNYLPYPLDHKDLAKNKYDNKHRDNSFGRLRNFDFDLDNIDKFPPLQEPLAPLLSDPVEIKKRMTEKYLQKLRSQSFPGSPKTEPSPAEKAIMDLSETIQKAGGQPNTYEDMRSDLVEDVQRNGVFKQGPIEGNISEGHEISVKLGNSNIHQGEIFDRPVELSEDYNKLELLNLKARNITNSLKKILFPNIENVPVIDRYRTSGTLDPARLVLGEMSAAVYRRYRMKEKPDRRGRPLLVIACDGSGSLSSSQMNMVKVLLASWFNATSKNSIQVLSALYHSGNIRAGIHAPLVQWIYHPHKTPSIGRNDAVRAIVTLPDDGTGVQSDALSVSFIMEEAKKIAAGKQIYLILISDCQWNRCFKSNMTGEEEVQNLFYSLNSEMEKNLHTTLIALGMNKKTNFENIVDKVINISNKELTDYETVAQKIGLYVASCISERKKLLK